ncbi:MAG TPA: ATP-binding protein [Edaphocola sp.]|nr:ATP-binding protein [Edaphocola sp.]
MPNSYKKLSPRNLCLRAAFLSAVCICILSLILGRGWQVATLIFVVSFIISYTIFYFYLKKFISNRLKLIYKLIYTTKAGRKEQFFYDKILPEKTIDEVEKEVVGWAEKKSSEIEQLQINEKFRKEFLSNLTHELRTPIFTVQGYIHTLLNGALEDEKVNKKFLANAGKGLERLVHLVNDLSQITALESGANPMMLSNFDLKKLVQEVYDELDLQAKDKKIKLRFKAGGDEDHVMVHADKEKIRQVLINLVENAIKYGKEGGHITTGFWELDAEKTYIEISDDGVGIEEEHLTRIFERFYRTDKSRSSSIPGTGLGLAIVKHIIEAHQQIVNVRSKVGVGSSFGFSLNKSR